MILTFSYCRHHREADIATFPFPFLEASFFWITIGGLRFKDSQGAVLSANLEVQDWAIFF